MLRIRSTLAPVLSTLIVIFALPLGAQSVYQWESYDKRVDSAKSVVKLGDDLLGDAISLQDGGLSFSATDVSLPGNSALPVAITRTWALGNTRTRPQGQFMADWNLAVPRISASFADLWLVMGSSTQRCSDTRGPAVPANVAGIFEISSFWQGLRLEVPGGGGELLVTAAGVAKPSDGRMWVWTTGDGQTHVSCIPTIRNGSGEGFLAVTPDGTRYTFDWMARRGAPSQFRQYYDPAGARLSNHMPVHEYSLYATRVEDRHGNWVAYTYANAATDLPRLTRIHASDGRELTLAYAAPDRISSVSDGTRTWTYAYELYGSTASTLRTVTRPDGTAWQINFQSLTNTPITPQNNGDDHSCLSLATPENLFAEHTGSIVHPSGAIGTFRVGIREHGRSNVTLSCSNFTTRPADAAPGTGNDPLDDINQFVISSYSWSLLRKEISGPGLQPAVWAYDYASDITTHLYPGTTPDWPVCMGAQCFQPACTSDACAGTARTFVVKPDGHWERHVFGNSWQYNEGRLLRTERGSSGGAVLETVERSFDLARLNRNYPARYGRSVRMNVDGFDSEYHRPQWSNRISRDGVHFEWSVGTCGAQRCFDAFARPTQIARFSNSGPNGAVNSKTDRTTWYDHTGKWVIGQLASTSTNGIQSARAEYDSGTANLLRVYQFGALAQTLAYAADGTVTSATDARNFRTTLGSWYRGVPRAIGFPDGTSVSATVTPQGWITSATDQNGFTTSYTYDAMGRPTSVVYPSGPGETYAISALSFKRLAPQDWMPPGVSVGQWQSAEVRGNLVKAAYYDAMFRPTATVEWDEANGAATARSTRTSYDVAGRVAFQSYPIAGLDSSTIGARTQYDALGRVTSMTQDSELGPLVTATAYLTGFQTRVTDPKGGQTTTRYLAYDEPSTDLPVSISQPGDVVTEITREPFGKPTQLRRRNGAGSVQVDRRYVYDARHRLCRQIDPETQATIFEYDANGNVLWSASGLGLTAVSTNCERGAVAAAEKTLRTHDAMNRVTLIDFPDASVDVSTAYTPDGLVATSGAGPHVWKYTYNRLRQPTVELLEHTFQGVVYGYPTRWTYDALGHRASMVAGNGITVDYAPNALGQPTRAGWYAWGALYHPDGALKSFTYGNHAVRTVEKNLRQLPSRIADLRGGDTILDDRYAYDFNGNPTSQDDALNQPGGDRTLAYDARDRLISAQIAGTQTETFTYDALDNLTRRQVGSQVSTYNYDGQRRLGSIVGPGGTQSFGYDVRGNMTSRANLTHTFDRANRLTAVSGKGSYEYDGHGRRTVSWRADGTGKTDLYDLGGMLRMTGDNRRRGNTVYVHLGSQLVAEHFRGWDGSNDAITYVHGDLLGSSVATTTGSGAILERERSLSYGQALDGSKREAPGFTGHMEDPSLGLVYMQQRYYDPAIGRFLSVDPVGPLEDPIQHFGRYHYANNNPYRYIDPDGRFGVSAGYMNPYAHTPQARQAQANAIVDSTIRSAGNVADFVPVVGDIKAGVEAIQNPSAVTITAAVVGLVPGLGDAAAKGIKAGGNITEGAARSGTDFVVTPSGVAIPIPNGAVGPAATINKGGNEAGFEYTGGSGGKGMESRVDGVRIMDANQHQGARAVYMNQGKQTVDPASGRTVTNDNPRAHHYLDPKK